MRPFFLGVDGRPCIWPLPNDCTWTNDRFKPKRCMGLFAVEEFMYEAGVFIEILKNTHSMEAYIESNEYDIAITKSEDDRISDEGYRLDVSDTGAELQAKTKNGILNGCSTLLQLMTNSPDPFIYGVKILENPVNPIRAVKLNPSGINDVFQYKRFIDFLFRYKINHIIMQNMNDTELLKYISDRCIKVISDENMIPDKTNIIDCSSIPANMHDILILSQKLWWKGFTGKAPEDESTIDRKLDRILMQLYSEERDRFTQDIGSFKGEKVFKTIEMRSFYNAPLFRTAGKMDDYDFMYIADAEQLPNTVIFDLFQGVIDFKTDYAMILAEQKLYGNISGIPVNDKVNRLAFMHACTNGRLDSKSTGIVGYYNIIFMDGCIEKIEIICGKTIASWRTGRAYMANPVYMGLTSYRTCYTVYSQEWLNPYPDKEIKSVDIILAENSETGIALFGITAALQATRGGI